MLRDDVLAYLQEQERQPFAWGVADCVQLAAGLIERATGTNPAANYCYSTEDEARALIAAAGGLEALISRELGQMVRDLRGCADGDIVLTAYRSIGQVVGIAIPRRFVLRTTAGMMPIPLEQAIGYWPCRR